MDHHPAGATLRGHRLQEVDYVFSGGPTTIAGPTTMAALGHTPLALRSHVPFPIVNGSIDRTNTAVVQWGGCTGTFVHPRFILTAAHCLPTCMNAAATGCIPGTLDQAFEGEISGRDGTFRAQATDGPVAGEMSSGGGPYSIDFVYFARVSDLGRSRNPDVALLRTTTPFRGTVIPVLPFQDLPKPPESTYCPRNEYTWPTVFGYSTDEVPGNVPRIRSRGRAFAECDLESDQVHFKLDGHGRDQVKGIRTCNGDSGGPVLWPTGFGGFALGGVASGSDNYTAITNTKCPSQRGESFIAFIPAAFLNRVASTDALCNGAGSWESCLGVPIPYDRNRLRYLGTSAEQCSRSSLTIHGIDAAPTIGKGSAGAVRINREFDWSCDDDRQTKDDAPAGTGFVIVRRALTDRQVIFDFYRHQGVVPRAARLEITSPSPGTHFTGVVTSAQLSARLIDPDNALGCSPDGRGARACTVRWWATASQHLGASQVEKGIARGTFQLAMGDARIKAQLVQNSKVVAVAEVGGLTMSIGQLVVWIHHPADGKEIPVGKPQGFSGQIALDGLAGLECSKYEWSARRKLTAGSIKPAEERRQPKATVGPTPRPTGASGLRAPGGSGPLGPSDNAPILQTATGCFVDFTFASSGTYTIALRGSHAGKSGYARVDVDVVAPQPGGPTVRLTSPIDGNSHAHDRSLGLTGGVSSDAMPVTATLSVRWASHRGGTWSPPKILSTSTLTRGENRHAIHRMWRPSDDVSVRCGGGEFVEVTLAATDANGQTRSQSSEFRVSAPPC